MQTDIGSRTLYLHIGLPKTASSWLQAHIFCNISHLTFINSPQSYLFQAPKDVDNGRWLMTSVFQRSSHIWESFGDTILQDILGSKKIWQESGRDVLISDERIGREGSRSALFSAHLEGLKGKAIEWGFRDVKVLFLIRRQDTWLASHYAQMSDRNPHAGQRDFERLLNEVISPELSRYNFGTLLDFGSLYQAVAAAVGASNVMVWPYEYLQENPSKFLQGTLATLGTSVANAKAIDVAAEGSTTNVRSAHQIWKLRQKTTGKFNLLSSKRIASRLGRTEIKLTTDLSNKVLHAYRSENLRFTELTGLNLDRYGYIVI